MKHFFLNLKTLEVVAKQHLLDTLKHEWGTLKVVAKQQLWKPLKKLVVEVVAKQHLLKKHFSWLINALI